MDRRRWLEGAGALPLLPFVSPPWHGAAWAAGGGATDLPRRRCRPGDPSWPAAADWDRLRRQVGGRLVAVRSPFAGCSASPESAECRDALRHLKNPYYLGDEPGLTQTSGWLDAWNSRPSAYAVAARTTADVVAAVEFARRRDLRLVVKGGGHSYQGTSSAPDSLLIWTHAMSGITLHDAFVARGCAAKTPAQPAVTVEAGALWMHVYDAVTTRGGRYVQGGGCATVGVAGLVQSGGFGSFSKRYGLAAAGLIEAEVVTADGAVRIANACTNPELFWGLKGGGGGSLGVVTRLTLRTHDLPDFLGVVRASIKAGSADAFRRLIGRFVAFYKDSLFNPHWGESVAFRPGDTLDIAMAFQGLDRQQAQEAWRPFLDWIAASPGNFALAAPPVVTAVPARRLWDAAFLEANLPGAVIADDRPGAPPGNVSWAGDIHEAGWFIHGYRSAWLPASLLAADGQQRLADALFASTRHWPMALHFNKGLAGAPEDARTAARDTAMNPAVLGAFALAICAGGGPPAYPGMPRAAPDLAAARRHAAAIDSAMDALLKAAPGAGSYVSESNFFDEDWQRSFWGSNYPRLLAAKRTYDPDGLFVVHHGVGSEDWSEDGFTRRSRR